MRPITKKTVKTHKGMLKNMAVNEWAQVHAGIYGAIFLVRVDSPHPLRYYIATRGRKIGEYHVREKPYLSYPEAKARLIDAWMNKPLYRPARKAEVARGDA